MLARLHDRLVFARRVRVLAAAMARLLPENASVLDVGCGDGSIDRMIMDARPDLSITGIDVLVRPNVRIPVTAFDGERIPFPDGSHDVVMFVDVLHHTTEPAALLAEARRVARRCVVLKDHTCDGLLARPTLRLMDWTGNAQHGVALPYNYWSLAQWQAAFARLGMPVERWEGRLGLYPWPAGMAFDRTLHFVARLGAA